jgi:predicted kinase
MTKQLIIMRGLPGSGKSTDARAIGASHIKMGGRSVAICSTDDFHMVEGRYTFQPDRLGEFHKMNQGLARQHMALGTELVIVDNTNIKRRDMKPYRDLGTQYGYEIETITVGEERLCPSLDDACPHKFRDYIDMCVSRNTHGVPKDVIERMAREFQE